jgi:mono/diheme cytochrome c family protein
MRLLMGAVALGLVVAGQALASQKLGDPQGERPPDKVYATTCGYCHGTNVGPIIRGRALPADMIKQIVRSGQNAMPAFRQTEITAAELDKLAIWISAGKADAKETGQ